MDASVVKKEKKKRLKLPNKWRHTTNPVYDFYAEI